MNRQNKIFNLFRALRPDEIDLLLARYAHESHGFRKDDLLHALVEWYRDHDQDPSFAQLVKRLSTSEANIRQIATRLAADIEQLLRCRQLDRRPDLGHILLLEALLERNQSRRAYTYFREIWQEMELGTADVEAIHYAFRLMKWRQYDMLFDKSDTDAGLAGLQHQFDYLCALERLRQYCGQLAGLRSDESLSAAQQRAPHDAAALLKALRQEGVPPHPAVAAFLVDSYLAAYDIRADETHRDSRTLWYLLTTHHAHIGHHECVNLYRIYFNHRYRLSDGDTFHLLEIYRWGFAQGLHESGGVVALKDLRNYLVLVLQHRAFDEARCLLETHLDRLPEKVREQAGHYCWGIYHFEMGEYASCRARLNYAFPKNSSEALYARLLTLKCD